MGITFREYTIRMVVVMKYFSHNLGICTSGFPCHDVSQKCTFFFFVYPFLSILRFENESNKSSKANICTSLECPHWLLQNVFWTQWQTLMKFFHIIKNSSLTYIEQPTLYAFEFLLFLKGKAYVSWLPFTFPSCHVFNLMFFLLVFLKQWMFFFVYN